MRRRRGIVRAIRRLPTLARVLRPAAIVAALVDRAVLGRVEIAFAAVVRDRRLFAARTRDLARAALLTSDDFLGDRLVTLGDLGTAGDLGHERPGAGYA